MFRQFLVGGGVSLVNITVHALVMTIVVQVAKAAAAKKKSHPSVFLSGPEIGEQALQGGAVQGGAREPAIDSLGGSFSQSRISRKTMA
jgi:hypothetical protein